MSGFTESPSEAELAADEVVCPIHWMTYHAALADCPECAPVALIVGEPRPLTPARSVV